MKSATVLIVPGLRDAVAQHWQTLLEAQLRAANRPVAAVPPLGREDLDCASRVAAIERSAQAIDGPIVIVAHSGGCVTVAHWAALTRRRVRAALLAVPPDFDRPLPDGYPTVEALRAGGWLPVPRAPLPFTSVVAASRNDPLADHSRVVALANDWGSRVFDLGDVGHLNPASGFGEWPLAIPLIHELSRDPAPVDTQF
ncbi:alpha/beta hydrolase [Rhizobacter sp. Root404]|uniref:RBBP9/YdeN family alpha/beta hydrolase n=1 Tax=Rhizobacter sp. Root404 TaxID=1736528 RepID=UPI00070171A0|nr:alpha/beta hydrolase [Rhizobacter sp. Root404]KQW38622.1 alpha/beta hydrolase [Rhizobacter sp. Root404]